MTPLIILLATCLAILSFDLGLIIGTSPRLANTNNQD